jgi:hypothetical protein
VTAKIVIDLDPRVEDEETYETESPRQKTRTDSQYTTLYRNSPEVVHHSEIYDSEGINLYLKWFNIFIVSEKFKQINEDIENLMFRNQAKMSNWKQETKIKKLEVQNARRFARNFATAMRNEVVTSIDITQGDFKKPKFQDKGERVQQRSKTKNVLSRT